MCRNTRIGPSRPTDFPKLISRYRIFGSGLRANSPATETCQRATRACTRRRASPSTTSRPTLPQAHPHSRPRARCVPCADARWISRPTPHACCPLLSTVGAWGSVCARVPVPLTSPLVTCAGAVCASRICRKGGRCQAAEQQQSQIPLPLHRRPQPSLHFELGLHQVILRARYAHLIMSGGVHRGPVLALAKTTQQAFCTAEMRDL